MDMNSVITTLRDTLADDTAIKTWCQATYGRDHTICVGMDDKNLPGQEENEEIGQFPYVLLAPDSKTEGDGIPELEHRLIISSGVYDESRATPPAKTNVVEYAGVQRAEDLRKLVTDAAKDAIAGIGGLSVAKIDTDYHAADLYPYFVTAMEWTLTEDNSEFGDDTW